MTGFSGLILDVTPTEAVLDIEFLERLGHPVLVCHGPAWGHACPIIKGACPKVQSSHGMIFQLDLDRPQHRVILKRYQEVIDDDVPIVVVVKPGQEERFADLLSATPHDEGFLDLRAAKWLQEKRVARPMGHGPMEADWSRILDALYFIREMHPSTLVQPTKAEPGRR